MRNVVRMTTNYALEGTRVPEFIVGDRLVKARESAGIGMIQMAEELQMNRRTLTRYERSATVKRSILLAYAMRTGVPVWWLEHGEAGRPGPTPGLPDLDSNQEPIVYRTPRSIESARSIAVPMAS